MREDRMSSHLLLEISLDKFAWIIAALSVVLAVFADCFFGNVIGADGVWIFGAIAITSAFMVRVLCSNIASRSFNDISAGSFCIEYSLLGRGIVCRPATVAVAVVDRFRIFKVWTWLDGFGGSAGLRPTGIVQLAFA